MNKESGVTLIEILIAVSLLSLLSVGALMAMRIGLSTMDKTDTHLEHNRRVANSQKIVEDEIAGFVPTMAMWHAGTQVSRPTPFVEWRPQSMRFVTSYSLREAWRGTLQIAEFTVIPGDKSQGVRLIVNEIPYTGPAQTGQMIAGFDNEVPQFAPIIPGAESFVLADRLAYCRFRYLEPRPEPPLRVWRDDWVLQRHIFPLGIRIEMAPLDDAPGELHVSTVTVPLASTRLPGVGYFDGM
ncbi:MAG TPA: prepilin-type N-terminal cleavage/methylation domain-containing protein [Bryobacteraceae bacterium]|nr:prepilin-type N-terminal cleavage/methylation domain-containing protein [Bryobacteraceae bacterium]